MSEPSFPYDVFLSRSAKDKPLVRPLAEQLRQDGLKVPFQFGFRNSDFGYAKPGLSAQAFGSNWVKLLSDSQPSTLNSQPTSGPLNRERCFIPLRLNNAPIIGSLTQFLCLNWRPADHEQEGLKARKTLAQGKQPWVHESR